MLTVTTLKAPVRFSIIITAVESIPPARLYSRADGPPKSTDAITILRTFIAIALLPPVLYSASTTIIFVSPSFIPGIGKKAGSCDSR